MPRLVQLSALTGFVTAEAGDGVEISPRLGGAIKRAVERGLPDQKTGSGTYFFNPDGSPKAPGTILRNPEFADSLQMIAAGGAREFYDGEIADKILTELKSTPNNPSLMTASDLAGCRAIERSSVCVKVR